MHLHRSNFYTHAHKYPAAFQNYITYATVSFLFLGASILSPALVLLTNSMTSRTASLSIFTALICAFLSLSLLMIPFINKNQSLFKSSIEKINELVGKDVQSENIILFGHSFGGAVASEVLKYFTDKNIKLGGIIFTSTFSSFYAAIKYFPISQARILSVLPSYLLKKILKILGLDFDIVNNIQKLQNEKIPIVIINHERDTLTSGLAQLAKAVENDVLLRRKSIKTINLKRFENDSHNGVLSDWKLGENLADLTFNKTMNR